MIKLLVVSLALCVAVSAQYVSKGGSPSVVKIDGEDVGEFVRLQTDQQKRITEIQAALKQQKLDGWLFYDFRGSDILIPRILKTERLGGSRRWFYYVPATGEPVKVVHAIEPDQIDVLPGRKLIYREWSLLKSQVGAAVGGKGKRIVMQYSPNNDVPYISRVDAGTIEMVRSLGINIET
ncbi:MAG: hypothetical protein PSX80_11005, partial [bacterium]|nr:hypothetical protein [bacterium]